MKKLLFLALTLAPMKVNAQSALLFSSKTFSATLQGGGTIFVDINSTITIPSAGLNLSTNGVNSSIRISTLGVVSFPNFSLHNSTLTILLASPNTASGTNTTFTTCLAGSTVTLTNTVSSPILVSFLGILSNSTLADDMAWNFLMDGTYPAGSNLTSTIGAGYSEEFVANNNVQVFNDFMITGTAPGTHSFCLQLASPSGGTWTLHSGQTPPQFRIREVK